MKTFVLTFLLIVVCLFGLKAQSYYEKDSTTWIVGLNTRHLNFNSNLKLGDHSVRYRRFQQTMGVRVGYKGLVAVLAAVVFPLPTLERKPTAAINAVLRFYPRNMYFRFDGSVLSNNHSLRDYINNFNDSYNADLFLWNLDAQGVFLLKKDQVDVKSFFAFRNKQRITAGSWTVNTYVKSTLMKGDEITLGDLGYDVQTAPRNLWFNRVGIGLGSLYAWKLTDQIQWANMVSLAFELVHSNPFGENASVNETSLQLNLQPHAFSSLMYNNNNFYVGLQFEYFPSIATSLENEYQLEFFSLRLSGGYKW